MQQILIHILTMKKIGIIALLFFCSCCLFSQIPNGYYSSATNKSGASLKTALCSCITNHTELKYNYLWTAFLKTDVRNNKIWDMYSGVSAYEPGGSQQGASYSEELDSYNREHSFPKSWFSNDTPMLTDLMHIVPTDGYVNGRRSNYPFGETSQPTYQSINGFSKLGPCDATIGYSGTVFEPNDIYKGDFARIYFYMVTCYENQVSNWSSAMLDGKKYPAFSTWALNMLLRWAKEDPVSQKEIDRNNAVFEEQGNRNPFVDFEGLEQYVWGDYKNVPVDLNNYTSPYGSIPGTSLSAPEFSVPLGQVDSATTVTLTGPEGATLYYSFDNGTTWQSGTSPINFNIVEATTIFAYAESNSNKSITISATYTVGNNSTLSSSLYEKVVSGDQLVAGKKYIISVPSRTVCMAERGSNNDFKTITTTFEGKYIDVSNMDGVCILSLESASNGWALKITSTGQYLAWESGNSLTTSETSSSKSACWNITPDAESTSITNANNSQRKLQFNAASNVQCFRCYTGAQTAIQLYVQVSSGNDQESTDTVVAPPTLTYSSGKLTPGSEVTLSSTTTNATIYYSIDGGDYQSSNSPTSVMVNNIGTVNLKAYAVLNSSRSEESEWELDVYPNIPVISLPGGTYPQGTSVSITSSDDVNIYYTLDGTTPSEDSFGYTDAIELQPGTTTITAIAELNGYESDEVSETYIIIDEDETQDAAYKKITSKDELEANRKYLIVYETDSITMGTINGTGTNTFFNSCAANASNGIIKETNQEAKIITLVGEMDEWSLYIEGGYLACQKDGNYIQVQNDIDQYAQWTISFDSSGNALIRSNYGGQNDRWIQYNSASNSCRFSTYKGTQKDIQLYKEIKNDATGIAIGTIVDHNSIDIIYDLQGRRVYKPTKGIYIINGKKVLIGRIK